MNEPVGTDSAVIASSPGVSFTKSRRFFWIVITLILITAAAGYFIYYYFFAALSFSRTAAGVSFEELLPENVVFAASFNPTDAAENERSRKLLEIVFQDKTKALFPFIIGEFTKKGDSELISLQEIIELFNDMPRYTVAATGQPGQPPQFYFLTEIKNPALAATIGGRLKKEYPEIAFRIYKDVFVLSNGPLKGQKPSFAKNKVFRKAFRRIASPLSGYVFLNPPKNSMLVAFRAGEDGFYFESNSTFSKTKSLSATLYKKVPVDGVLFFAEISRIGSMLLAQLPEKILQNIKDFNFKEDILPFLNKNSVIALNDTGAALPAFSFFTDANNALDKAKNFAAKLDEELPVAIGFMNLALEESEGAPVIELKKIESLEHGSTIYLHLNRISKESADIALFKALEAPLQISYGLTADNIFFISMLPDIEKRFVGKATIEGHPLFADISKLSDSPDNFAIIDTAALSAYLQRFVQIARDQKTFSEKNEEGFSALQKYLAPIKGIVWTGDEKKGKGLLRISQ